MAKASGKDYKGLGRVLSIVLVIIPVTSWIMGFVTRFKEGHILAGVIRLVFGFTIVWILDIVFMLTNGHILRVL